MYEPPTDRPPMIPLPPPLAPPSPLPQEPQEPKRLDPAVFRRRYKLAAWLIFGSLTVYAIAGGSIPFALMFAFMLVLALRHPKIRRMGQPPKDE